MVAPFFASVWPTQVFSKRTVSCAQLAEVVDDDSFEMEELVDDVTASVVRTSSGGIFVGDVR